MDDLTKRIHQRLEKELSDEVAEDLARHGAVALVPEIAELVKAEMSPLVVLLQRLKGWAEHMGGWDAPVWADLDKQLAALDGMPPPGEDPSKKTFPVKVVQVLKATREIVVAVEADDLESAVEQQEEDAALDFDDPRWKTTWDLQHEEVSAARPQC